MSQHSRTCTPCLCLLAEPELLRVHAHEQAHAREADLERQRSAIGDIEADAAEESRVNIELAGQLSTRLDASRRASERLLGTFQVTGQASAGHPQVL